MGISATPIIPRDGVMVLSDNTGTPKTWTVLYRGGDLKINGWTAGQKELELYFASGKFYGARMVTDKPLDIEFTCDSAQIIGDGTTTTLLEVTTQRGAWSGAKSMVPAASGDGYALTMAFTIERSNFGQTADNVVTFTRFFPEATDWSEGSPSKWSIKGRATPTTEDGVTSAITLA